MTGGGVPQEQKFRVPLLFDLSQISEVLSDP